MHIHVRGIALKIKEVIGYPDFIPSGQTKDRINKFLLMLVIKNPNSLYIFPLNKEHYKRDYNLKKKNNLFSRFIFSCGQVCCL